ncbi:Pr6Pr family membrane protein [Blastococcus sp. SYSU DS0619]
MTETPSRSTRSAARAWWAVLAVVVAASVGTEFVLHLADPEDPSLGVAERIVRFFSYFTVQSNLLVLAAVLPLVRDPGHDGRLWRVVRLASLLGITITGIVYAVVLAPLHDPAGIDAWTNAGEHYASPVMTVVGWLVLGPRPRIDGAVVARALLWPVAWIGWILAQGTVTGWYPYDFMDVGAQGYATALRNLAFVVLLALAFLLLFRFVDRRLAATGAPASRADRGSAPALR